MIRPIKKRFFQNLNPNGVKSDKKSNNGKRRTETGNDTCTGT